MNISIDKKDEKIYFKIIPILPNKDKFTLSPSSNQHTQQYKLSVKNHYL